MTKKSKSGKAKLSSKECKLSVLRFFEKQKRFKQIQAQYNEAKAQFNSDMENYFEYEGISKMDVNEYADGPLVVNRIQKSSVEFDPDKLEKALGKLAKDIIIKRYEIVDMTGLIAYLKECGVDPKVFKSFLNVSKTVDTRELDRLEELGKITASQVDGCYTIKYQNPYFTVSVKKGCNND